MRLSGTPGRAMPRTPFRTPRQNFLITEGDEILAEGAASASSITMRGRDSTSGGNNGGDIIVQGGANTAGSPGNTNGGNVVLTPGLGTGTGSLGVVAVGNNAGLQFTERASMPGPSIVATQGRLWLRATEPNTLMFTDDSGAEYSLMPLADVSMNVRDFGARGNGVTDDTAAIQAALDAANAAGGAQTVLIPRGTFMISSTINHPATVRVRGTGPGSIIRVAPGTGAIPCWQFPVGVADCEVSGIVFIGEIEPIGTQIGTGIDINGSLFINIHDVQVWYFNVGIDVNDGTPYTAHVTVGPNVEVNACQTGIRAYDNCHACEILGCRVFYSYTPTETGIGLDVDDASGLTLQSTTFDGADTCLRVRTTDGNSLQLVCTGNYWEPGPNPSTASIGLGYDIDLSNAILSQIHGMGNHTSANRGRVFLDPAGLSQWDGYSQEFFGSRYHGASQPRRNYVRNGAFYYYNNAVIPNWTTNGSPTFFQNQVTYVTGNRSLQVLATAVNSSMSVVANTPDEVGWLTVGVRYQVLAGSGFSIFVQWGGNSVNLVDPDNSGGTWQIRYLTVQRDPAATQAVISISPDLVDGIGECLIDEVWAYSGSYAAEGSTYGERIEVLPAPVVIMTQTLTGNGAFGPIDITDLPSVLAPPLDDYSTAPRGVVGAVYRFTITTDSGVFGTALTQRHSLIPTTPGSGAVIPAENTWVPSPQFSQVPMVSQMTIRGTSIVGVMNAGDGFTTDYEVAIVAWVLA